MATSAQRSPTTGDATPPALQSSLNLMVLGLAAFGLGAAGLIVRSFPVVWSGFAVSVVFVVLGAVAATPLLGSTPRWCSGYIAVAVISAVATPWMPAAAQFAGALTLLGVGFVIIGSTERLQAVRCAGLAAVVVGALTSSELGRGRLPLAETGTYDLVPALTTAIFGVGVAVVGVWLLLRHRQETGGAVPLSTR